MRLLSDANHKRMMRLLRSHKVSDLADALDARYSVRRFKDIPTNLHDEAVDYLEQKFRA